jgi:hypothetical protein
MEKMQPNYVELLKTKIVIDAPNADFTPRGRRVVRVVRTRKNGRAMQPTIAWYVGGKLYRYLPITAANVAMSQDWVSKAAA